MAKAPKRLTLDVGRHISASLFSSVLQLQKQVQSLASADTQLQSQYDVYMALANITATVERVRLASQSLQCSVVSDGAPSVAALCQLLCSLLTQLTGRGVADKDSALVIKVSALAVILARGKLRPTAKL